MSDGRLNASRLNSERLNNLTNRPPVSFLSEIRRMRDATPLIKVEFIEIDGTVHDVSEYYLEGANFEQVRERAPDEIQAGNFDLVLSNRDDTFSEFVSGSLLEGIQYHGAKLRVSVGFRLPTGIEVFEPQMTGIIDQLRTTNDSRAIFRCRDRLKFILDSKFHTRPQIEIPVNDSDNVGDGVVHKVQTKPFATVDQDWTLTCTLGGGNGVATFSVVGSISSSVGTATSGTEFTSESAGIRFTISAGDTNWAIGDIITFSTRKYPEWDLINPGKIIWSVLTGYDWETDTQEDFSDFVLDFDHTQSDANTDLDYDSFSEVIDTLDGVGVFNLKGYAAYSEDATQFIQNLLTIFLGSLFTGNDGRIRIKAYVPSLGEQTRTFSDDKKISVLGYSRTVDEIINAVQVDYKGSDTWPWSEADDPLDAVYAEQNDESVAKFKSIGASFSLRWFSESGQHAQDFANKLMSKYAEPPTNIDFTTGMDAVVVNIGDLITVFDRKYGINYIVEITRLSKMFDEKPKKIEVRGRRDAGETRAWGFVGSEADEGDGVSPQTDDYDTATAADRQFAYFSQDGEETPNYRMF